MGAETEIAWTDSTFNPWIGCQKVSPGCDRCYAETLMDHRYHRVQWGPHGTRVRTSAQNWRGPLAWQRKHHEFYRVRMRRRRVFCASLADVFDNRAPQSWRADLWVLIEQCPDLDWLLLTKRPENIPDMIPQKWIAALPGNVWLGVTAENQENYDRRMRALGAVKASVHFVSYEPALGPLDITRGALPSWLICGGESGAGYRDMPEEWAEDIRRQCERLGVPFLMKQMAGKKPIPSHLVRSEFPVPAYA